MKYLVDTSALVRILRRQVDDQWHVQVTRGLVANCDPVLMETLTIADAKAYTRIEDALREAYPWVPVPTDAWDIVTSVRRELATKSAHQGRRSHTARRPHGEACGFRREGSSLIDQVSVALPGVVPGGSSAAFSSCSGVGFRYPMFRSTS